MNWNVKYVIIFFNVINVRCNVCFEIYLNILIIYIQKMKVIMAWKKYTHGIYIYVLYWINSLSDIRSSIKILLEFYYKWTLKRKFPINLIIFFSMDTILYNV